MRKLAWLVALLGLVAVGAEAQDCQCSISWRPPCLLSGGGTLTGPLAGTTAFFTGPVSIGNTSAAPYANLYGDAANTLALRNGGTAGTPVPQAFNLYNFCDGAACVTGYERMRIAVAGNQFEIKTEQAGTGSARPLLLSPAGPFYINANLTPYSSDLYSIGTSSILWISANVSRVIQGSKSKTLVDAAAAVSFVRVAVATNASAGGTVIWNAMSTNGTAPLTQVGSTYFAGVNTAGTVTCTVGAVGTPITAYSRVNTLACTVSAVTSTTNCDLQVTCTDNLAGDQTPVFNWRLDMPVPNTVTPQ